jgi:hypothetical protein
LREEAIEKARTAFEQEKAKKKGKKGPEEEFNPETVAFNSLY